MAKGGLNVRVLPFSLKCGEGCGVIGEEGMVGKVSFCTGPGEAELLYLRVEFWEAFGVPDRLPDE